MHIYISPNGNDSHSGSEDKPFATLHKAQEEVRARILSFKPGDVQDIEVHLAPGVHRLKETLVMNGRDSGRLGNLRSADPRNGDGAFKVSWIGNEGAVVSSGFPLKGWIKADGLPEGAPKELEGKIWYMDLPGDSKIKTIMGPNDFVPRARGEAVKPLPLPEELVPATVYGPDAPIPNGKKTITLSHDCFAFAPGDIDAAPDLDEAECLIIPRNQWTMNILPVGKVDFEKNILFLKESCTYPIGIPHCAPDGSIWLENSLSVLTPGSWVYHEKGCRLYYCPKGDAPEENLEAALLVELIRVEGKEKSPVDNLNFKGIRFTGTGRFSFHGLTGRGIQHDWEMHDASSCMIRFRHVRASSVSNCRFSGGASGGIRLDLASSYNRIENNEFANLGGCGILLCGYGLSRNYLNRNNTVSNNHLHHLGLAYWHCPGIFVWQSGENHIRDNYLHDLPYTAIVCSGRTVYDREGSGECSRTINWDDVEEQCGKDYVHNVWHYSGYTSWAMREPLMHSRDNLIEYNRISHVMQVMGDGNGIYVSGAGGGNVVRFNAVGPCPSPTMAEGIRCDDDQHHTILHGNLIFGIGGHATGITLKGVNRVTNNIIALPFVEKTVRGMLSLETGPLNGSVIRHNIIYTSTKEQLFVHEMRIHGRGRKARLRDTESDRNFYFCTADPALGNGWIEEQRDFGSDYSSLGSDPLFTDAPGGDFTLKAESPVIGTGFRPLPLRRMLAEPIL